MTNSTKRFGKRWTINECIQLEREFELLHLSIDEIAKRHQRTPNAIMFKLNEEGLADYNVSYSNYHNLNSTMPVTKYEFQDEEDEIQEDDDNSSDYQDEEEEVADDSTASSEYDEEPANHDLKQRVLALEEKITQLTELIISERSSKKSWFS
jgi:hypothetical protein